ncbi:MAG: hypothetical protein IPO05_00260 [Flavobacteriales bacterium]|nr:hypothetical protein [Flavobacteriales bacterium]MBK9512078.1 hypothetical protein [Flavobacteriales bacterium]MBP7448504.1 hypothetical protein [Flavobacteriales bacterium]
MATARTVALIPALLLVLLVHAQAPDRVQVSGRVYDAATGRSVLAALVEWVDINGAVQAVSQTNDAGGYGLFVFPQGPILLRVKENGYSLSLDTLPDPQLRNGPFRFDIALTPAN